MTHPPWLHDLVTCVRAPTAALSASDGQIRSDGAQGLLHNDVRVLSRAELDVSGGDLGMVSGGLLSAAQSRFIAYLRDVDTNDPSVQVIRTRTVQAGGMTEQVELLNTAAEHRRVDVTLRLEADGRRIDAVKAGLSSTPITMVAKDGCVRWAADGVRAVAVAPGAAVVTDPEGVAFSWSYELVPNVAVDFDWRVSAEVDGALFVAGSGGEGTTRVSSVDRRLSVLVERALDDVAALRLAVPGPDGQASDECFLAAGAPWYFTLFGRDSLISAGLMLPFDVDLAAGTLRVLAARQGRVTDSATGEQPGKIPHEQRRTAARWGHDQSISLPPLYYGTVDATPLWVCLLHDAWRHGLADGQVRALLPAMTAALGWMAGFGDGFLTYPEYAGTGLVNQGWKDSADAICFDDGQLATGPIALCEVQGYAYEAAMCGAVLLEAFGLDGATRWRSWAQALAERFRSRFWTEAGYPALALDGTGRRVDSMTSNMGHLLGTGILDAEESARVATWVTGPNLDSGFGVRTMSAAAGGFSPSSYHRGSVWPHDTAMVILGLCRAGHAESAVGLITGIVAAGAEFDGRIPELYSGFDRARAPWPVPYPLSCRPQAWSAATAAAVVTALLGLRIDVPAGVVTLDPIRPLPFGAFTVSGLRAGSDTFDVTIDERSVSHTPLALTVRS